MRAIAGLILGLFCLSANAALHGRLPLTPSGTDYRAYYDDVLNITWLADANRAQTSGYEADGRLDWDAAQAWIASLNNVSYLGVRNWRLPNMNVNADTLVLDCIAFNPPETACRDNELGYLYVWNGVTAAAPSPFTNIQSSTYWSSTELPPSPSPSAWSLALSIGYQTWYDKPNLLYGWAVRAGDIDADGDAVAESQDNCTLTANPTQLDSDGDGYGNLCDGDLNNTGLITAVDFNLLRSVINQLSTASPLAAAADMNGSGLVTSVDFNLLRARINAAPGPSALAP